jgi:hypothetical protein
MKILAAIACLCLSACSSPAVSKAVGTGSDGGAPIIVRTTESAVVIENHAGRPLLNVRISIAAADAPQPFVLVVPTIDAGATSEAALTTFRREDATMLDPTVVHPTQVAITARDTLAKAYEITVPWQR